MALIDFNVVYKFKSSNFVFWLLLSKIFIANCFNCTLLYGINMQLFVFTKARNIALVVFLRSANIYNEFVVNNWM